MRYVSEYIRKYGLGFWATSLLSINGFIGLARGGVDSHFTPAIEIRRCLAVDYREKRSAIEGTLTCLDPVCNGLHLKEVSFAPGQNTRFRRVIQRIGRRHEMKDDFDYHRVPKEHRLKKHVLYCFTQGEWEKGSASKMKDELVDVQAWIPGIQVELKYATAENFTGKIVYSFDRCFLLKEVALRLKAVQGELKDMGLGLKIWDGFRPIEAQWKFWELVPDERYVSDPRKGGRHTRGTAVDVTLVTKEGREVQMPSAFDDFSEKAHRDYKGAAAEEIHNRELLQKVMETHGFVGWPTEWWHFDLMGWENYPPLYALIDEKGEVHSLSSFP